MSDDLDRARRLTLDALVERFAHEQLNPDEFERRVGAVRAAQSVEELRTLLVDLPAAGFEPYQA